MKAEQIDLKGLLERDLGLFTHDKGAKTALNQLEKIIPRNLMYDAESTEFKPETRPMSANLARGLTVEEAKTIDDEMNRFIDVVLIEGIDYGFIPNCPKPTLFKSGAEKILSYLGLIARTRIVNRVEDYNTAFFSYESKVYLIDVNGIVRGEGVGVTNSKEEKYAKSNGFNVQNVILKMSKKRALVDAALNVGNLSSRFTQDIEDVNSVSESKGDFESEALKLQKQVSDKQYQYLCNLIKTTNITQEDFQNLLTEQLQVKSWKELNSASMSKLIDLLKKKLVR